MAGGAQVEEPLLQNVQAGQEFGIMTAVRQSDSFIRIDYEDLVISLATLVHQKMGTEYLAEWKEIFKDTVPVRNFIRTQRLFARIVEEYEDLDPTNLASAAPQAQVIHAPTENPVDVDDTLVDENEETDAISHMEAQFSRHHGIAERFLHGRMESLMGTSGFMEVTEELVDEANQSIGKMGLDVHVPSQSEVQTLIYYRGMYSNTEEERTLSSCYCEKVENEVKMFRMLVFIYRFMYQQDDRPENCCAACIWQACAKLRRRAIGPAGSENKIYIRCYNDIAISDMDMLWPGAKPNPTWLDIFMVVVPFLVGLGFAIQRIVVTLAKVERQEERTREDLLVVLLAVVGPFTLAFSYYTQAKNKYTAYKARHAQVLVDHTVSTNRGTMMQLLAAAADQENKEFLMAYTVLALSDSPLTKAQLQEACNDILKQLDPTFSVTFDVDDATTELLSMNILEVDEQGGMMVSDLASVREATSIQKVMEEAQETHHLRRTVSIVAQRLQGYVLPAFLSS